MGWHFSHLNLLIHYTVGDMAADRLERLRSRRARRGQRRRIRRGTLPVKRRRSLLRRLPGRIGR